MTARHPAGTAVDHFRARTLLLIELALFISADPGCSLAADEGLRKIATIVHYLSVGGLPVPEANAIETVPRGVRDRIRTDDEFLAQVTILFDDLYEGYSAQRPRP